MSLHFYTKATGNIYPDPVTVAIIPYFDRPEMLWHCLFAIDRAERPDHFTLLLKPDWGITPHNQREHYAVISQFMRLNPVMIGPAKHVGHPSTKQSANVLHGLRHACNGLDADHIVHLIEDDVIVGPDHFTWSERTHHAVTSFCVITSANCNGPNTGTDPEGHYLCQGEYRGIGTSFRASTLRTMVLPHARPEYFAKPKDYISRTFTPDPYNGAWFEQDGLIRRIQHRNGIPIAYATNPKSYHGGYYGKNRKPKSRPRGTLNQRIDQVGRVIYDPTEMRRHCQSEAYYLDSVPITLVPFA